MKLIGIGMLRVGSRKDEKRRRVIYVVVDDDDEREKVAYHIVWRKGIG